MGLFDIIDPFAPLKIVKDVIDGDSLSEAVENDFERKFMSAVDFIAPVESRTAKYGDIIGVKRSLGYKHFGVYVGKGKVIHYASESGDFGGHISIHETTMSGFLDGDDEYFILEFPDTYGTPKEVNSKLNDRIAQEIISLRPSMRKIIRYLKNNNDYHLYSPRETVRRARSRIGESDYNLATNNCEHFAIWCKTGISESHQVNMLING